MRQIYLMRGVPASGKSSWLANNGLLPWTISADQIRLIMGSPETDVTGDLRITQAHDRKVWKFLMETVEDKMSRGELIIVDATHYKASLLQPYKQLAEKYRYRLYVIDFTDVPVEVALERNMHRPKLQYVPEDVIRNMAKAIQSDIEVSKKFTVLSRENALSKLKEKPVRVADDFEKVVFIGDIHGCWEPLRTYFEDRPMSSKNLYVFTGDYIDRGVQNKEVLEFLLKIYEQPNVILLEGNHERWLREWSAKDYKEFSFDSKEDRDVIIKYMGMQGVKQLTRKRVKSREFVDFTVPQIADISKKELRQLCRKLYQTVTVSFQGKKFVVTHGGVPVQPTAFMSTEEIVKGVGGYEDLTAVYQGWTRYSLLDRTLWMVHGHRNLQEFDVINEEYRTINLCDTVESGGFLRVVEVDDVGIHGYTYKNDVFKEPDEMEVKEVTEDGNLIEQARKYPKLIQIKDLGKGLCSLNFTSKAFTDKKWNDLTIKARGLFLRKETGKVVARSYSKFFNLLEREETSLQGICKNTELPCAVYKKENGFLGIVSLWNDKLLVCSKSQNFGEFAQMMRDTLIETLGRQGIRKLKNYLRAHDNSLVFECINLKDRHMIKYDKNEVVLLEGFANDLEEHTISYTELWSIAQLIGCRVKERTDIITDKKQLIEFVDKAMNDLSNETEGYVFEGANHFRFKLKTPYYKFWKQLRGYLRKLQKGSSVDKEFASRDMLPVIQFMQQKTRDELKEMDIIDVREAYDRKENEEKEN